MSETANLEGTLDELLESTDEGEEICLSDVLDVFQDRILGPVVLVPAVIVASPIGGIPGLPTMVGVFLVLVAGQKLFGKRRIWLPKFIRERGVEHDRLEKAVERFRPWAQRVDRVLAPRLSKLLHDPMPLVNAALIVVLGAAMPFLEVLPFATMLPAAAVALLGLAITARDGAVALVGWILAAAGIGTVLWAVL